MWKNMSVSLVTILVVLLVGELFVRIFMDVNYLGNSSNLFVLDAYGSSKGNTPNIEGVSFGAKVYTDEYGFRVSPNENNKGDSAVLILGDSVAFGSGVGEDETFVGLLKKSSADVKIYNSAVIGYGIDDYKNVIDFFVLKHKEIKQVYLIYCLNDLTKVSSQEIDAHLVNDKALTQFENMQKLGENGFVQSVNSFLREHSKLYLAIRQNIGDVSLGNLLYDMQAYDDYASFGKGMKVLLGINDTLKKDGIGFIVELMPYEAQIRSVDNYFELRKPQEMIKQYFDANGIKYSDVLSDFVGRVLVGTDSRDFYLYRDAMHLSTLGHKVVYNDFVRFWDIGGNN